jgi:diguanylate cyclase (GGDEF)-like protein/PAS domain S-box-containing protein
MTVSNVIPTTLSSLEPWDSLSGHDLVTAVLEVTDCLVIVLDRVGRIVRFNASCQHLTGYALEDVQGRAFWDVLLPPEVVEGVRQVFQTLNFSSIPNTYENEWLTKSGERRLISWSHTTLEDTSGAVEYVIGTGLDITERREAEQRLRESEERFRALFERSPDGVVLIDPHDLEVTWRIVDCNAEFCRMNGYERHELIGRSIDIVHDRPMMAHEGPQWLEWISRTTVRRGDGKHRHKDGSTFLIESSSSLVTVGGRELILGIDRDVTERRRDEARLQCLTQQLEYEAHHDTLTHLPNRALFEDRLEVALNACRRNGDALGVMFLDLDRFKQVNDTLGHHMGDELLKTVAVRLRAALRRSDTLSRRGGDEFTLVLPGLKDAAGAARVAQKLLDTFREPFQIAEQELYVSASIGVSLYPRDGIDAETLQRHADVAMYRAKSSRNSFECFAPEMNAAAHERLKLETDLRHALEREQFKLYYQPQVDLQTRRVVGCEALLRWEHPELGVLAPDRFLQLASDCGLMAAVDTWVLREACQRTADWRRTLHPALRVAVNLSGAQFNRADLIPVVSDALQAASLEPSGLELELSETVVIRRPEDAIAQLERLKALGVRVSIDDFGTGYSSLSQLRRLPFDQLKIDRSFVRPLGVDRASTALAASIVALGHGLSMEVIAEGVETETQMRLLQNLECDSAQGYLIAKPLERTVFEAFLQNEST